MPVNRRQFFRQTAQAALLTGSVGAFHLAEVRAEGETPSAGATIPIVDTHQHLWDLGRVRLSWLKSSPQLNRSHVMKDYLQAAAGLNIVKAVYMEVAADVDCQVDEAEYISEICRRGDTPTVAAVIGGCPGEDSFRPYITRHKGSKYIKGVRQIPRTSKAGEDLFGTKTFIEGIRLLGELGMCFDLCGAPSRLRDAAQLVDACPDTRFVLDHCGNADPKWFEAPDKDEPAEAVAARRQAADQWRRDLATLAERKSVVCKISGIVARARKETWTPADLAPVINHCLEAFGPDRVMFAGDWPVCTRVASLGQWVRALQEVVKQRSQEERRKLFHDNAVRFYGLS
jgi:predicted TIM-barrel fold metal-dependent hydrolase